MKKFTERAKDAYPATPDGRYFIVRGRLWRRTDPGLSPATRKRLVQELMAALRAKGLALRHHDHDGSARAHHRIDRIKRMLGERGSVWWTDGAPDYNRHMVHTTPYADWFASLSRTTGQSEMRSRKSKAIVIPFA